MASLNPFVLIVPLPHEKRRQKYDDEFEHNLAMN